ncbi:MAG: hypothetical protein ABI359_12980 [Ginsengibacter sp.]
MTARIIRILGIVFLCSICFFPLLRFVAPLLTTKSLTFFILMSIVHSMLMIVIAMFVNKTAKGTFPFDQNYERTGLFLFLSGVFFVVAFGMGAPPRDANVWLQNSSHEILRAICLELAAFSSGLGLYYFSRLITNHFSKTFGFGFLFLAVLGIGLTIYDFYWGLVIIPNDIETWSKQGKDLNQFFDKYDMKNGLRGTARCLIYIVSILTFFIGWKLHLIKSWVAIILSILCIFFFQDVFVSLISDVSQINLKIGMVPVVALSPLYLFGVYLISTYKNQQTLK